MDAPERWGRYTLLRQLGSGGMAQVFLARQEGPAGFERYLVVKRILPGKLSDPEAQRAFLAEAKLAAQLSHPHVAQVHDFGQVSGTYYIAMELVRGPDLRRILAALSQIGDRMAPELCALVGSQVSGALDYAHSLVDPQTRKPLQVVHRDVSPDNLVVSVDGHVKIVDFGIAQAAVSADGTHVEKLRGKVPYMSPQVLHGEPTDRQADLYALGLVLFEMAVGRRAIVGSKLQMLEAARAGEFPSPESLAPDLPKALLNVIHKATAREPKERYLSAREIQIDLDALLRGSHPVTNHDLAILVRRLFPDGADPLTTGPLPARGELGESAAQPSATLVVASLPQSVPIRYQPWWLAAALAVVTLAGVLSVGILYQRMLRRRAPPPPAETIAAPAPAALPAAVGPQPAPVRPTAKVGTVVVESVPGGDVFLDGKRVGMAPVRRVVSTGTHEVTVRYLGASKREPFPLAEGEERRLSFNFAMGELRIFTIPWSLVSVDGKEVGATPLEALRLPEGKHKVTMASAELRKTVTKTVDVKPNSSVDLRVDLRR